MDPIKPPSAINPTPAAKSLEPEIKVMPERFIGAPLKAPLKPVEKVVVVEKIIEKRVPTPVQTKKGGIPKWALFATIFVLLAGGGAFYYVQTLAPTPPPQVVTTPPPPPPPPVTPPPVATSTPTPPSPTGPREGVDSDSDGLSDEEEREYGSNPNAADSDRDGFIDGVELFHLYNPAGLAPVRLIDTGSVLAYSNPAERFQIYYPKSWRVSETRDGKAVIFRSAKDEYIEVLVEENPEGLPVVNWFLARNPKVTPSELETFITKSNLDGVKSPDRFTAYIRANGSVYGISYNLGADQRINFRKTFEMMLNSFTRTKQ